MTKDDLDRAALGNAWGGADLELAQAKCIVSMLLRQAGGHARITAKQIEKFDFEKTKLVTRRTEAGDYELWIEVEGK